MKQASNDQKIPVMLSINDDSLAFMKDEISSGDLNSTVSAVEEASMSLLRTATINEGF